MPEAAQKLKVLVSYSRVDHAFADELAQGLEVMGFDTLIDRNAIREGEDWKIRLGNLIAEAGTVVFVLSPDSARSPVCEWELEQAQAFAKRIIPVLWRGLDQRPHGQRPDGTPWPFAPVPAPARLSTVNYVRFDAHDDGRGRSFMDGLKALAKALNTDLDWLNEHTRLLSRAIEWDRGGRPDIRLMSGTDILEAKAWAARHPASAPPLTVLHLDYIRASEAAEGVRNDEARRQLEERQRLLKENEVALRSVVDALDKARAAQKEQAEALVKVEAAVRAREEAQRVRESALAVAAAEEAARAIAQRRAAWLVWAVAGLALASLTGAVWTARLAEQRESRVMLSKVAEAISEGRTDRAMRFALAGLPPQGAVPLYSAWNTGLEGRLAGVAMPASLKATLTGHGKQVNAISYSADGRRIATASDDGTARLWDASTAREISSLVSSTEPVTGASFSPDGLRIVIATKSQTTQIVEVDNGKVVTGLSPKEAAVRAGVYSPDGTLIATPSEGNAARLWDAETGLETAALKGHTGAVMAAVFSPDGRQAVTASDDATAIIWDVAKASPIAVLKGHDSRVKSAAISPDGRRVVTGSADGTARLWDAGTATTSAVLKDRFSAITTVAFSPDGRRIATAGLDEHVRLWDTASAAEIAKIKAHEGGVLALAFSPDGESLATAGADKIAKVWDIGWMSVYGPVLRDRICAEKLIGAQEFTEEELTDPTLSGIDRQDPGSRNPCLRRGPLSAEFYVQAARRWGRWAASLFPSRPSQRKEP